MSIAPLQLAQFSNAIYQSSDGFDNYWMIDDVVIGHKQIACSDVLVLRGSSTTGDWLRDARAIPEWHPQLGFCHAGFVAGMDDVFGVVRKIVGPSVVITGHSLGAARARILAGLFACAKLPVDTLCVFGSPKPAFINLARVIQKSGMKHMSYRNRNDIVPTLPLILPAWEHTEAWTTLDATPDQSDLEPLRDHSCELYVRGLLSNV